jgi:hypothetical protein
VKHSILFSNDSTHSHQDDDENEDLLGDDDAADNAADNDNDDNDEDDEDAPRRDSEGDDAFASLAASQNNVDGIEMFDEEDLVRMFCGVWNICCCGY